MLFDPNFLCMKARRRREVRPFGRMNWKNFGMAFSWYQVLSGGETLGTRSLDCVLYVEG